MRYLARLTALFACVALGTATSLLAVTPEQQEQADAIEAKLKEAGTLAAEKKFDEARPLVIEAQTELNLLALQGAEVKALVKRLYGRLASTHRVLTKKGVDLSPLVNPEDKPADTAGTVSYSKDVVPIFVARCNGCHVQQRRGGFSLATYADLVRGSDAGTVFTPGTSQGSRLMDVLQSGDMPRGGGPLSAEQLASIATWIDEGAKFDGTDPNARISAPAPDNTPRPVLEVVRATGNEATLFSRDIAPVLAAACTGCHGGQNPAAQLRLETFATLLAGNNNGLILAPGNAAESLIIKKIKGTAGTQMPLNQSPLPEETIALFEKWVAEGAKYDGPNPADPVEFVANVYRVTQMTHDELAAYRGDLAQRNWSLAIPDEAADRAETENFLLLGNIGQSRLTEFAAKVEEVVPKVARIFKSPANKPLLKGRLTLFVFGKRYDYSEFGQMVERREVPEGYLGHFRYNVVDAYGAVLVPEDDKQYSLTALAGQQLAGAYLESQGSSPAWFSQGVSWAVGAKVDAKDPVVKQRSEAVPEILSRSQKADDFLTGALPPADSAILNASFAEYLMSNSRGFGGLLNALRRGTPFDQAFQQAYRGTPAQLAGPWAAKVLSR